MEYIAVSISTTNAATPNNRILKTAIKSPIDKLIFLLIVIAKTSVPSITAPPRMVNPIPAPIKKPPKTAIKSRSLVIGGN